MLEAGTAHLAKREWVRIALQSLGNTVVPGAVVGKVPLFPIRNASQRH